MGHKFEEEESKYRPKYRYLTCDQKLAGSQFSLQHIGLQKWKKLKRKTLSSPEAESVRDGEDTVTVVKGGVGSVVGKIYEKDRFESEVENSGSK